MRDTDPVEQRRQRARLAGPAVDLVGRAVAGHDVEQVVDDPRARVEQQVVDVVKTPGRDRQAHAGIECHGHDRLLLAQSSSIAMSSSYASSAIPNQCSWAGKVRVVTSAT